MIYSDFYNPTTSNETEKNKTDLVKLDQETTESLNNKLTDKNSFLLKMKDRALNVKEICSRFHRTFNGRLGHFFIFNNTVVQLSRKIASILSITSQKE